MKLLKYSFILMLFIGLASCHKDEPGDTEVTQQPGFTPEVITATTGDVLGYVYDEAGDPVSGATVRMLKENTTTDAYGVFKFKSVELDQQGTYLTVRKDGYILGSDMIFGLEDGEHAVRVRMMALSETGSFTSSTGGTVTVEGGGQVVFAANSVETADGEAYTGEVKVTAKRLASDDPFLSDMMPGGLLATDADGSTRTLGTMGMVAVELRSTTGAELNLKPGTTAQVVFPIAADQQTGAPDEIDLWSFDESLGLWIEEGTATRVGDTYEAEVSHFSFWNCDAPFPLVNICGKVVYEDGTPASLLQVAISAGPYGVGYGWTNYDGTFSGKVPKGQVLTIQILNYLCEGLEVIYEAEYGGFDNKTILDDIVLPLPANLSFEGVVKCSGLPVANATVFYELDGFSYALETSDDGSFSFVVNDDCEDVTEVTIYAVDPATGLASAPQTVTDGSELLTIQVCSDCDFELEIVEDSSIDLCVEKQIEVIVTGSGSYSYEWTTGSTTANTQVSGSGQYCVTVTDTDLECEQVICSSQASFRPLQIFLNEEVLVCGGEDAQVNIFIDGGTGPYTTMWSDPAIVVDQSSQSDSLITSLISMEGTYTVTVTDANGCTAEGSTTVLDAVGFEVTIDLVEDCDGATLFANLSNPTDEFSFAWSNGWTGSSISIWSPGTYCVTITNAIGCSVEECIEADFVSLWESIQLEVGECTDGTYTINNFSATPYDLELMFNGDAYPLPVGGSVDIDLIPTGFTNYWFYVFVPDLGCEVPELQVNIPGLLHQNAGITYEVSQPTCPTCVDGAISLLDAYLQYTPLNGAVPDGILVLDGTDYSDVTASADAGTLPAGTYYVVVTDENTGCYIYSDEVILE